MFNSAINGTGALRILSTIGGPHWFLRNSKGERVELVSGSTIVMP